MGKQKEKKPGMDEKPTNTQIKLYAGTSLNWKSVKTTEIYVKANNSIRYQVAQTLPHHNVASNKKKDQLRQTYCKNLV